MAMYEDEDDENDEPDETTLSAKTTRTRSKNDDTGHRYRLGYGM